MKSFILFVMTMMALLIGQEVWAQYRIQALGANGYDVVAYHTQNKAVPGSADYYSFVDGVTFLFANKQDKDLFDANPSRYLPAYGGYCAMALVLGKKHPTNPEAFLIVNGKLYLNKASVRKKWLEDVPGNIKKADVIWEKIKDVDPAKL